MKPSSTSDRVLAALISIQFLFGMNYVFSKVVLQALPPLLWASLRAMITAVILAGIAIGAKRFNPKHARVAWRELTLFSLLGVSLNQGSFLLGLKYTSAVNSSLINTLIPVFTILMVTLMGQESTSRRREFGFLSAFIGVLLLHNIESFTSDNMTLKGDLLTLFNAIFYSLFLTTSQDFFRRHNYLWATTWIFIFGAVGLFFFSLPDWLAYTWRPLSPEVLLCAALTIVGGTVLPYLLISYTLSQTQPSLVALFIYLQPLVATVLGYLFFRETITLRTIGAGALIFIGVFLAITDKKRRRPQAEEAPEAGKVLRWRQRK